MKTMLKLAVVVATILTAFGTSTNAHAQSWGQHIDWSATNSDAGGSVDCPGSYISMDVEYAIVSGGRAAVINEALFAAYRGDVNRSYQLVLLTQCHNPEAQGELLQAGGSAVVGYLVQNWSPEGVDPSVIRQGVQTVIAIFGGDE